MAIGWITDLAELAKLKPLAGDQAFRAAVRNAKREAKSRFAQWLRSTSGVTVDPDSIFDSQVKRIHEYKRQLLNALRVVVLYDRLRQYPSLEMAPRTFFFAGKAAPAYHLAKVIIKFLNNLAGTIDGDPAVRGRLKVVFLPEYSVSLAERLIPASDVSNQISTAGYEASGTSNMKFMMNGALTIGTRDGATIEMAEAAGEENFFLFGLTAEQVAGSRGWYSPQWHYDNEPETRAALDLIFSDHFSRNEPGVFEPLRETLLTQGDHYMHLADLTAYLEADRRLLELYAEPPTLGAERHPERRQLREVLERPHHRRVRGRDLAGEAVPGALVSRRDGSVHRGRAPDAIRRVPGLPRQGVSSPLGATPCREGANFSVFSKHATGVELLLFDRVDDARPARAIRIDPAANRTYHYWHVFVPDVSAGQLYGYRVEGPWDPANGHALRSRQGPPRPVWPRRGGSGWLQPHRRRARPATTAPPR